MNERYIKISALHIIAYHTADATHVYSVFCGNTGSLFGVVCDGDFDR